MGLLQQLAAVAIRNKVLAALRSHCPDSLKDDLEALLADAKAVDVIQHFVSSSLTHPESLTREALLSLPLPQEVGELLSHNRELTDYLLSTARSHLQR